MHERPINIHAQDPEPGDLLQASISQEFFQKGGSSLALNQVTRTGPILDMAAENIFQLRATLVQSNTSHGSIIYPLNQFAFEVFPARSNNSKTRIHRSTSHL